MSTYYHLLTKLMKTTNDLAQRFKTYMKVKSYTSAVVISFHCKHIMFTYISVGHKHTAKHCNISRFHTNVKATAPYLLFFCDTFHVRGPVAGIWSA